MMSTTGLLAVIGLGILAELLLFIVLRFMTRLESQSITAILMLSVIGFLVPWSLLNWHGGDVFAIELGILIMVAYVLGIIGRRAGAKWHWAPAVIFAFFAFVISVNVVFVSLAENGIHGIFSELLPAPKERTVADSRFPGTVPYDYQEKEALYNAWLKQVEVQEARGWQIRKGWQAVPVVGRNERFLLEVRDREGVPIEHATVHGKFIRPSNSQYDFNFTMQPDTGGFYVADITMPLAGLWTLVLSVEHQGEVHELQATTSVNTGQ